MKNRVSSVLFLGLMFLCGAISAMGQIQPADPILVSSTSANPWKSLPMFNSMESVDTLNCYAYDNDLLFVWGGTKGAYYPPTDSNEGAIYSRNNNAWTTVTSTGAPSPRHSSVCVRTNPGFLVWGGVYEDQNSHSFYNDGAIYSPATGTWTSINNTGAPDIRYLAAAVSSGTEVLIWGGQNSFGLIATGGVYNLSTNTWRPITPTNAPASCENFFHVWVPSYGWFVWGGLAHNSQLLDTGAIYNPASDQWTAVAQCPYGKRETVLWFSGIPTAIWTGTEVLILGGSDESSAYCTDGIAYNPATKQWRQLSGKGLPYYNRVISGAQSVYCLDYESYSIEPSLEAFDPSNSIWKQATSIPATSATLTSPNLAMAWLGNKLILYYPKRIFLSYDPKLDTSP